MVWECIVDGVLRAVSTNLACTFIHFIIGSGYHTMAHLSDFSYLLNDKIWLNEKF